ncbi:MAG: glycosyltransferase family 39 protein [Anaerolineae bacterium]|nr:glycosyltransferase family 39 protein [Anaerolineae bacterium]
MTSVSRLAGAKSLLLRWWGSISIIVLSTLLAGLAFNWVGVDFLQADKIFWGWRYDEYLNSYALWQALENLQNRPTDLGYSLMFHNNPNSLGYTIAPYGIAIFTMPLYVLSGENIFITYNVYLFLTLPMTALAAYLLVRQVVKARPLPAIIAALMLTFCQYRFAHFTQIENQSFQFYIFGLYAFHMLLEKTSWRWVVATALAFWLTFLTSGYFAAMFVVTGLVIMVYLIVKRPDVLDRRRMMRLGAAAGLFILLVLPFLPFRLGNEEFSKGVDYDLFDTYSAPIEGWGTGVSLVYSQMKAVDFMGEQAIFLGFVPWILTLLAWRARKSADAMEPFADDSAVLSVREGLSIYGITILIGMVLSLGPVIRWNGQDLLPGPAVLLYQLPFFSNVRVTARYIVLAITATALFSGYFLTVLEYRLRRANYAVVMGIVVAALFLELVPYNGGNPANIRRAADIPEDLRTFATQPFQGDSPAYDWLAAQPADVAIVEFPEGFPMTYNYLYMLRIHQHPIFNGSGSFYPARYGQMPWNEFLGMNSINLLLAHDIDYMFIHNEWLTEDIVAYIEALYLRIEAACEVPPLKYVQTFGTVAVYGIQKTDCIYTP